MPFWRSFSGFEQVARSREPTFGFPSHADEIAKCRGARLARNLSLPFDPQVIVPMQAVSGEAICCVPAIAVRIRVR